MLVQTDRPAEALAAYEALLATSPNRLYTLYGAGLAAERAGDAVKARQYYTQVMAVAVASDPGISRIEHARAFLAHGSSPGRSD
jgi:cytochrome c-type biogenesis protein CcmH/NrfG